jgi:hypothetical protein
MLPCRWQCPPEVKPGGQLQVQPYPDEDESDTSWQDPAWGQYKQQGTVLGMPIMVSASTA